MTESEVPVQPRRCEAAPFALFSGSGAAEVPPKSSRQSPYPGLRPFLPEERHLFFGRTRDARLLENKILSGSLTVLYAPSGVGKTSLLKTLVVPGLSERKTQVIYYDRWPAKGATGEFKAHIIALQGKGVTGLNSESSLTKIVRAINRETRQSVVLLLDQFEEFLNRNAGHLAEFRDELAELVRADIGVHVVLSLREEFLGKLEPFASHILSLYNRTFRLKHLTEKGTREAIEEPASKFGKKVDGELVDQMLRDLPSIRQDAQKPSGEGVELPLLQIVCEQLWLQAERQGDDRISLQLYKELDGSEGLIKLKIKELFGGLLPQEREQTARVLMSLGPPSGLKHALTLAQLAEDTKLAEREVEQVLKRLEDHWVVRAREVSPGNRTYELYHDFFIRVLRPWAKDELKEVDRRSAEEQARRKYHRWLIQTGVGATVLVVVILVWQITAYMQSAGLEKRLTVYDINGWWASMEDAEKKLAELSANTPERDRRAAMRKVNQRQKEGLYRFMRASSSLIESKKYEELEEFLKANERKIPPPTLPETFFFNGLFKIAERSDRALLRLEFASVCTEREHCEALSSIVKQNFYPPWLFLLTRILEKTPGERRNWYDLPTASPEEVADVPPDIVKISLPSSSPQPIHLAENLGKGWATSIMMSASEFEKARTLDEKLFTEVIDKAGCETALANSPLKTKYELDFLPIKICPNWLHPVFALLNRMVLPKEAAIAMVIGDYLERGGALKPLLDVQVSESSSAAVGPMQNPMQQPATDTPAASLSGSLP